VHHSSTVRTSLVVMLVAATLFAVTAIAFMFACAEEAQATHAGPACALHEGHVGPDALEATAPVRSRVTPIPALAAAVPLNPIAGHAIPDAGSFSPLPSPAVDPLFGRLLL